MVASNFFAYRLVRLMNKLLDLLERDPDYHSFNLDGQTSILEDYLEVHPEKRDRLKRLVSEKRLLVGPWYILPDSFLCGDEVWVRNLLLGQKIASEFGHSMEVGYIPDTFGHIGQLPQILREFGLDSAMHFRGLDIASIENQASELKWQSPDGSWVLLHHLSPIMGYSDSGTIADNQREAAQDFYRLAKYKMERATTDILLALQGVDHVEAREDLSTVIGVANDVFDDVQFKHASLEEYWDALRSKLDAEALSTVFGEIRDVPRTADSMNFLLYNVLSSRADNKLDNARTLTALQLWAEPWSAQAWLWDIADYPQGHLWTAWRWLLKNHPHDSIGGCSVDEVHRQMTTRFEWAREIGDYLTEERHRLLVEQIDLSALRSNELAVVLFNASPWERDEVVSVEIDIPEYWLAQQATNNLPSPQPLAPDSDYRDQIKVRTRADWAYGTPELPSADFRGLWLRPLNGDPIPLEITNITETTVAIALASGPRGQYAAKRVKAHFRAALPSLGYATYALSTDPNPIKWPAPARTPNQISNDYLTVLVNPNGTFDLIDKQNDLHFTGLGLFEDGGDNGDGYMYSPPPFDTVSTTLGASPRIEHIGQGVGLQKLRIHHKLQIPLSVNEARDRRRQETVVCPLTVELTLRDGVQRLEMAVTFDNRAKDHRLRMLFPTGMSDVEQAASGMQFDVVTRPIRPKPIQPGDWWVEDPPTTFPMHGWMDMNDGAKGLSMLTEGIYEFAVGPTDERPIALTLLRAVGYLGAREDLTTIIRGAGPSIPTPEAQLQKKLTWRIALYPHNGGWEDAEVWRQSAEFLTSPRVVTTPAHSGHRPPNVSGVSVSGKNAVVSSIKQSENGKRLIVRLHNPSDVNAEATITIPSGMVSAEYANLREQPSAAIALNIDGSIPVALPPKKIVTVSVHTKANAS